MEIRLNNKIDNDLKIAEKFCKEEGLVIDFTYDIEDSVLNTISERTDKHPSINILISQ